MKVTIRAQTKPSTTVQDIPPGHLFRATCGGKFAIGLKSSEGPSAVTLCSESGKPLGWPMAPHERVITLAIDLGPADFMIE